jgi:hypothetical protein
VESDPRRKRYFHKASGEESGEEEKEEEEEEGSKIKALGPKL